MPSSQPVDRFPPAAAGALPAPDAAAPSWRRHAWIGAVAGFVAYESALHRAAHQPGAEVAALWLGAAPFLLIGFLGCRRLAGRIPALLALLAACAALWLWRAPLAGHFGWTYYLQHAGANAALGAMFALSLRRGHTPLCTQIATAIHGTLSAAHARYTVRVTQAWTLFFAAMVGVSTLLFVLAPVAAWSSFANLATPLLIALMFAGEAVYRRIAFPDMRHGGLLDAVHGYRALMAARAAHAGLPR
ncbi:acyl carrier protein [Cupriavidus taiwanensis]|uniref:COG4648 family protein n=1 Tax=Cupriavidus taiwanensis TaxID=164546 RepID=UPI00157406FD|nr:acyl carrier protein [Cupriavidus taiwanensis]NSX15231.1 acyl carrier protein [Cupriavidus taiwanensis]